MAVNYMGVRKCKKFIRDNIFCGCEFSWGRYHKYYGFERVLLYFNDSIYDIVLCRYTNGKIWGSVELWDEFNDKWLPYGTFTVKDNKFDYLSGPFFYHHVVGLEVIW